MLSDLTVEIEHVLSGSAIKIRRFNNQFVLSELAFEIQFKLIISFGT